MRNGDTHCRADCTTALALHVFQVALLAAGMAGAQEPPVFRSTTRLVQINVVVHGKDLKPADDLKKSEFQIFENGKPQQVTFFALERGDRIVQKTMNMPRNVFSNRLGDDIAVPTSVTVIVLDMLNTSWTDQVYARTQVAKFLSQIRPGDRVALYALGRGLRVLHDYTTDASQLVERLRKHKGEILPELDASSLAGDRIAEAEAGLIPMELLQAEQRMADFLSANRVLNTLKSLEAIGEHLAAVPGRKSLVWVSGGFPLTIGFDQISEAAETQDGVQRDRQTFFDEVERTVRALNHANVAVYPVDARGLMVDPQFAASNRSSPRRALWSPANLDTMDTLAQRTGGRAYYNSNDIAGAVREVFNDAQVTYTLGFYSSAPELDGRFRDLKVKVSRPSVNVRHRKGYFALADFQKPDEEKLKSEMRDAVWSPLDATAIGVNTRVDRLPAHGKLSVWVQVDPATCAIEHKDDRYVGRLDFGIALKDGKGSVLSTRTDKLEMRLLPATFADVMKKGLFHHVAIDALPTAASLRLVVRDAATGLTGSVTVPMSKVFDAPAPAK